MTQPDPESDAFAKHAARKGLVVFQDWDHDRAMQLLRENRRRYAHTQRGRLLSEMAGWMGERFTADIGIPTDHVARVLLCLAGQLGSLAFTAREQGYELRCDHICNVVGYLADDLSRPVPRPATEAAECDDQLHRQLTEALTGTLPVPWIEPAVTALAPTVAAMLHAADGDDQ